ncbi:hypothetical protein DZG01_13660 [Pseudomonas fluorescens]|nr:hypothetical protein DZG01_13660 [Pseudomonas fluorescens]
MGRDFQLHSRILVGASLLAIAECQLAQRLAVPTPSRAGSLPQWIVVGRDFQLHSRTLVGASLLAIAVYQLAGRLAVLTLS